MANRKSKPGIVQAQTKPKAQDGPKAQAVVIDQIIPLPPAVVKSVYEGNADTNAYTDAEKTKLAAIEAGATTDQTGAEIVTAIDAQLGQTDWQGGGGGGAALSRVTDEITAGGATVKARRFGADAVTFTGDGANGWDLTIPAGSELIWLDFEGDSATSNASGELVLRVDNSANTYDRRFVMDIVDLGPDQDTDEEVRGHIMQEVIASNVTTITIPNISGNYPNGFAAKFR